MPLSAGAHLGPYEILAPIGAGGMGEVYKARDTRLDRTVAIKTSRGVFSDRFEREAHAIAALNHPHICQLYDVGSDYLVMEYVDGKPLTGPFPLAQVFAYAAQICDALDAAHRQGITHRDLKPANILLAKSGVKILDFGLAKIEPSKSAVAGATETMALTAEGTILGTLQYMSPEQIEGQDADARSDIFAFGLVLYEMITGKRPFTGASKTSLIASILKDQPQPLRTLEPLAPAPLERIVATCLEKDPDKRWQSARELKHALDWIRTESPSAPPPVPLPAAAPKTAWLWPVVAMVSTVLFVLALWAPWRKPALPTHATRFQVDLPRNVEFDAYVSVSPDGRKLVFNATGAQSGLWIHDLDTLEWRKLEGTEGARSPFWSPDSRFLGFGIGTDLKKIDIAGGPPQTLCTISESAGTGSWGKDGVIVFGGVGAGHIRRVSEAGGVPADVTVVDAARGETFHALPSFLPDGKHFLYLRAGSVEISGVYIGSLDAKPAEQSRQRILANRFAASFVDGNLFFMRDGTLMAQPFDASKLQLRGEPVPVAERVRTTGSIGIFSVSQTGVLAYRSGPTGALPSQPTWFDRQGKVVGSVGEPGPDRGLTVSPQATHAAGRDAIENAAGDIWLLDFTRGVRTRLTFRQNGGSFPVWSSDGSRIIFSAGNTLDAIYEKPSNGAGDEKQLLKHEGAVIIPSSWSRDGRFLLYTIASSAGSAQDLWVLPLAGQPGSAPQPVKLLGAPYNEGLGSFSPDGRWIAYISSETGRNEVYVRPFLASGSSDPSLGDGKWQVSKDGTIGLSAASSTIPRWRSDGKELFFHSLNSVPVAVDVSINGSAFQPGIPHQLFTPLANNGWDVTADGKRFLVQVLPGQQSVQAPITVVLNWEADLKR